MSGLLGVSSHLQPPGKALLSGEDFYSGKSMRGARRWVQVPALPLKSYGELSGVSASLNSSFPSAKWWVIAPFLIAYGFCMA